MYFCRDGETISEELPHTLLSYCRQIAYGMNFLSNKAFVHRDLAARNILVSEDAGTCKVTTPLNGCHVGVISMLAELRSQDVWLIWGKARALGTSVTLLHA